MCRPSPPASIRSRFASRTTTACGARTSPKISSCRKTASPLTTNKSWRTNTGLTAGWRQVSPATKCLRPSMYRPSPPASIRSRFASRTTTACGARTSPRISSCPTPPLKTRRSCCTNTGSTAKLRPQWLKVSNLQSSTLTTSPPAYTHSPSAQKTTPACGARKCPNTSSITATRWKKPP